MTRRIRSPHPGVRLNSRTLPSGQVQWRARFVDPDTNKMTDTTLTLSTAAARRSWAIEKSKALSLLRMKIESGGARIEGRELDKAIKEYAEAAKHRLRSKTLLTYGQAFDRLRDWAKREGVRSTADITRARLVNLRDYLIALPTRSAHAGGRRGERKATARKRSPLSINRELRSLKTLLAAWIDADLVRLQRDDIRRVLKALPALHEQAVYLAPAKIQRLLQAAQRHDAEKYEITRLEHAGVGTPGTTPRYEPIAPFAAFLLLTGMRRGEALGLKWADVDLEALDARGVKVGEIRLRAEDTKTHRARTIGLEVSPALRAQLAAMKLRAGKDAIHVFELRDKDDRRRAYTGELVDAARKRLRAEYGAPDFDWQSLRSTCATYLTNAPAIFGAATVYMSARQLGHSVAVAEKHYLGVHRGIPREARTLEAAMQIEGVLKQLSESDSSTTVARVQ